MSNNQQSSVEWLINQLQKSKDWNRVLNEISQMGSAKIDIIEQAKAMHKEEMVDFGNDLLAQNDCNYIGIPNLAKQYYNETYESNT